MVLGPASPPGKSVVDAVASALRNFGSLDLSGGALAQTWMPTVPTEGSCTVLQTKGLPFSMIGPGDMLALFRCLSCKYSFSTDLKNLAVMGAPGRVFTTGEAETCDDVQQCNVSIYLRVKDAQACRVSSTVLLPLFSDKVRKNPVAVLEVTQFHGGNTSYETVFDWARSHLEVVGIYIPAQMETRAFEMESHAFSVRFLSSRDSALGCMFSASSSSDLAGKETEAKLGPTKPSDNLASGAVQTHAPLHSQEQENVTAQETEIAQGSNPSPWSIASNLKANGSGESEDEGISPHEPPAVQDGDWEPREHPANKALLSREDLDRHFGYGLKEAAVRLGVCKTTLKRACRRYGIARWPRRDLLKAAKQQKESPVSSHQVAGPATVSIPIPIPLPSKLQSSPMTQSSPGRGTKRDPLTASESADRVFDQGEKKRRQSQQMMRCTSSIFPRPTAAPHFPTRHSLPAEPHKLHSADIRGVISMNWPMPSQIGSDGRGFLRTHQAARAPSIPPELADLNGHSLGNFVDALLGQTPFPNDPDLPEMPDEWESSLEAFELDKAAVRSKTKDAGEQLVGLPPDVPEPWQMDIDAGLLHGL